jgi:hypothetical protein
MTRTFTYDGGPLDRIRIASVELTESAETGQPGDGRFTIDDTQGTQAIVGQMDFTLTEDDCTDTLCFGGEISDRTISRQAEAAGTSREIEVTVQDYNARLGWRTFFGTDAKRPAETVDDRIAWLIATDEFSSIIDNGRIASSSKDMDAADYRNQSPGDVLADCVMATGGWNYHVQDYGATPELIFRDDNTSTADSSTLRISNVLADIDNVTTFAPSKDASLSRRPGRVISKVGYAWSQGTVVEERAATATAFNGERDGTASNSNVKTAAQASDEAESLLWTHHTEEDVIEVTVILPSDKVNLIRAGYRMQAKFSHMTPEGYGTFNWFRVLSRTKRIVDAPAEPQYEVRLKLSPQEAGPPAATIVQRVFARSGEGGVTLTLPSSVTVDNLLVFGIADRGRQDPPAPQTGNTVLPRFGSGTWTKVPNVTAKTTGYEDGVAFYVKKADSTSNQGYVGASSANMGLWEIAVPDADATIAGITSVYETEQSPSLTMSIGSLGTAAAGTVAMLVCTWTDQVTIWPLGQSFPSVAAGAFTVRRVDSAYEGAWIIENSPFTVIADALGDGSSLAATVTKSHQQTTGGVWGTWAGVALLIEPL